MPKSVKYFDSTMSGAPALNTTAGSLFGLLDACLVNGFGSVTLNSLVVASNIATGTISTGHNFAMVGTTGPVITIEGATPSALNGEWRIASVPGSTTFTFATTGITDQTATGTITAKRSPAGFSKAFSGTNKAAYRSDNIAGTRLYLRVDDSATAYARIRGYETMSDVDTGTGLFPTDAQISGGLYTAKPNATRAWALYSDGRLIYIFNEYNGTNYWDGGFVFGDFGSYLSPDAYGCWLVGATTSNGGNLIYQIQTASSGYIARSYTQLGTAIACGRYSHGRITSQLGISSGGQAYPALVGNAIHLWPIEIWEGNSISRGILPGLWNPIHNSNTPHGTLIDSIPNMPNRTFKIQGCYSNLGFSALDLTGPWR